jgi:acylphosphatase
VQGVGFRWFVRETARRLDLAGWVKNRADGGVEVAAEGTASALDKFGTLLREGPPGAAVNGVDDLAADSEELPKPFAILR